MIYYVSKRHLLTSPRSRCNVQCDQVRLHQKTKHNHYHNTWRLIGACSADCRRGYYRAPFMRIINKNTDISYLSYFTHFIICISATNRLFGLQKKSLASHAFISLCFIHSKSELRTRILR